MNHYEEILKICKDIRQSTMTLDKIYASDMFRHFIELLGEKDFNEIFDVYFVNRKEEFNDCFYDFHKSMRQTDFYDIGEGHLDMLFWNFIQISEISYEILLKHYDKYKKIEEYKANIGKKVTKCSVGEQEENGKKFKSGNTINTVKGIIMHEFIDEPAYIFEEDDSYVECRRCKVI